MRTRQAGDSDMKQPPCSSGSMCIWRELSGSCAFFIKQNCNSLYYYFPASFDVGLYLQSPELLIRNVNHLHLLPILEMGCYDVKTNSLLLDATEIFRYWAVQARIE